MYTLLNHIVFYIFHSMAVCVDFLGTHMTSLVLFFRKPGVTPATCVPIYLGVWQFSFSQIVLAFFWAPSRPDG
jgi:hypothetical protein